jgi:hypothetical protein
MIIGKLQRVDLLSTYVFGFLIPAPTGIIWTNQVGGTLCAHPEIEGLFIPAEFHNYTPFNYSCGDVRDMYADTYDEYLGIARTARSSFQKSTNGALDYVQELSKEEFEALPPSARVGAEAWVPFVLLGQKTHRTLPPELKPFEGQVVIVTWRNSD